jgi:hypothetical protein
MTEQISFPPLHDLSPDEFARRKQHLLSEISRQPERRSLSFGQLPPLRRQRRWLPVLAVLVMAVGALAVVPIGGASLGSRAINGISSLWGTPMNQPNLDAAANQARQLAAKYYTGSIVRDAANKVDVYLVNAPQSVIDRLRALHPDIYLIHNHAPNSLAKLRAMQKALDPAALKADGIDVVQYGPTPQGYLRVGVSSDVATAQAKLDQMYGTGVIQVVHAEPASSLMP